MKQFTYTITQEAGMHARPAGRVVKLAGSFESEIVVALGDRTANLKSILSAITLGAVKNSTVTVTVTGPDEEAAAAALEAEFKAAL